MIVDAYHPDANFVSARQVEVAAAPERVWEVLPELPVALRSSLLAKVGAVPLMFASVLRGEHGRGVVDFGRTPWTFREGVVLAGVFSVDRVDPGREVVLPDDRPRTHLPRRGARLSQPLCGPVAAGAETSG
jgi:hypothetical protein